MKKDIKTKNISQKVTFKASSRDVYDALMDSKRHSELSGEKAEISKKVGGSFTAYGGYIEGKNLELVPGKKIVQSWRASYWPKGHFSTVTYTFTEKGGVTHLDFKQVGVPVEQYDSIKQGWIDSYWKPMKKMFEK